jgi:hypothetical protein
MAPELPEPTTRNVWYRNAEGELAIIFIHGLASNVRDCWLASGPTSDIYWPWMVSTDPALKNWGIFLAGYNAEDGGERGISACAQDLYRGLANASDSPLKRRGLVFVCHSLGGVVARQCLVDHYEEFRGQRIHLMLLASPSRGAGFPRPVARIALGLLGLLRDRRLSRELAVDLAILEQLDQQFWRLRKEGDTRYLPGLSGVETSEHAALKTMPVVGRVVQRWSAERYFPAPEHMTGDDHASICKPSTREARIHVALKEGCALVTQSLGIVPTAARRPNALREVVDALHDTFGFRYEPAPIASSDWVIYWPVRVRPPTPIHAQQAFVAGALSRLGIRVQLWLDDLGRQEYGVDRFGLRLRSWFESVGGDPALLHEHRFSVELSTADHMEQAWTLARKWLGDTDQTLGDILRLSKLEATHSLELLLKNRPRRLLTPPIVWLGLRLTASAALPVITLGGWDEVDLWDAWRTLGIDAAIPTGHLYGAKLRVVSAEGEKQDLRMKAHSLAWTSRDDIHHALNQAELVSKDSGLDRETLPAWSLLQCVFLHQFLRGIHQTIAVGDRTCHSVEEVWNLPSSTRTPAIVEALSSTILE